MVTQKRERKKKETLSSMPDANFTISSLKLRKLNGQWSVGELKGPWRLSKELVPKLIPSDLMVYRITSYS